MEMYIFHSWDFNGNVYISFLPASETSNVASHSWLSS